MEQVKRLYRSTTNRVLGGVCGGLGDYLHVDPTLIRVAFVILAVSGGVGILTYLILWLVIPEQGQETQPLEQRTETAAQEMKSSAERIAGSVRSNDTAGGRMIFGLILIGLGVMALGNMLFPHSLFRWDFVWPLIIVAIGLAILMKRK